jgi:hypothetical protein
MCTERLKLACGSKTKKWKPVMFFLSSLLLSFDVSSIRFSARTYLLYDFETQTHDVVQRLSIIIVHHVIYVRVRVGSGV